MEKIIDNIGEVTDQNLEVIIATHAHRDHISGFEKFGNVFQLQGGRSLATVDLG